MQLFLATYIFQDIFVFTFKLVHFYYFGLIIL